MYDGKSQKVAHVSRKQGEEAYRSKKQESFR